MRRLPLILLACLVGFAASARAQDRSATLRAFYHALPELPEAELLEAAQSEQQLQAGLAALELHRRTQSLDYATEAARAFSAAVKADREDPWAHFGLGLTLTRARKTMAIVRATGAADGEAVLVARRAFEKAIALDPNFTEVTDAYIELRDGTPEGKRARSIARADSVAETLADRADGYFAALAAADETALELLIRDINILADQQERIVLNQGSFAKRKKAVELFWKKRAVRDGVTPEERVTTHYRRIGEAVKRYAWADTPAPTAYGKQRTGLEAEMDDRGLIYVRFGEPYEREEMRTSTVFDARDPRQRYGLEIWAYLNPDGRWRTYYFSGGRLEADPMKVVGAEGVVELRKYEPRYASIGAALQRMRTRSIMLMSQAQKQAFLNEQQAEMGETNRRIAERNRNTLFAAFDMDAAPRVFAEPLTMFSDFATFRGNGCTDVVYALAVPADAYRLNLAVADTFTWDAQTLDTMVVGPVDDGEFLRTTGTLCTTPDYNAYVRLTVATDSVTGVTGGGEIRIPDYSGRNLMMSSLLFARAEPGRFVRGDARLDLVPPRQFAEGESMRIFYELYNLPAGRAYRTDINFRTTEGNVLSRLFKGKTNTTVTFEGSVPEGGAKDNIVQELRTLVPQIEAGETEVTVTVTDLITGESARSTKTIWIVPTD